MTRKLNDNERLIVVKALRAAARKEKGAPTGKGDQRLLHARRRERYTAINELATEFEQRKVG